MAVTAGSPILALLPQGATTFTYGQKNVDAFTPDETIVPVATFARPVAIATATGVTVAVSKTSGNVWVCFDADDDPYLGSFLYEINATSGAVVRKVQVVSLVPLSQSQLASFPKLAERRGYHALFDLGCDKLLTVNRRTGDLIRLKLIRGASASAVWQAVFDYKYKLNVAPLDGAINVDGTRLLYCVGNKVNVWDLEKDAFFRTVVTVAA